MEFMRVDDLPPSRALSAVNAAIQREFRHSKRQLRARAASSEDVVAGRVVGIVKFDKLPPGRPNRSNALNKLRKMVLSWLHAEQLPFRAYRRKCEGRHVLCIERRNGARPHARK